MSGGRFKMFGGTSLTTSFPRTVSGATTLPNWPESHRKVIGTDRNEDGMNGNEIEATTNASGHLIGRGGQKVHGDLARRQVQWTGGGRRVQDPVCIGGSGGRNPWKWGAPWASGTPSLGLSPLVYDSGRPGLLKRSNRLQEMGNSLGLGNSEPGALPARLRFGDTGTP